MNGDCAWRPRLANASFALCLGLIGLFWLGGAALVWAPNLAFELRVGGAHAGEALSRVGAQIAVQLIKGGGL